MKISATIRKSRTKKGQSLYLDIYSNGVRKYEFLGLLLTGNKAQDKITLLTAEEIRIKKLAELQRSVHGLSIESKVSLDYLINEMISQKFKESTKNNYRNLRVKLSEFDKTILSKKLTAINLQIIDKFKEFLLTVNSQNSAHVYLFTLKSCFKYAIKKDYLQVNPMDKFDIPARHETEKGFLTIPELKKLESYYHSTELKNSFSETLRAFLFACYTGLRYSDVNKLQYGDINENKIKVKMTKTGNYIYIPLSNKAKELIESKILNHSGLVFNLVTLANINSHLKKIFDETEIKKEKISFHLSRHSFATIGLTIGIDIETISKILGHKKLATTQVYAKIVNEKIENAMNKFNSL